MQRYEQVSEFKERLVGSKLHIALRVGNKNHTERILILKCGIYGNLWLSLGTLGHSNARKTQRAKQCRNFLHIFRF